MSAQVTKSLNEALANAIVFYHKLHHFHWSVKGPQFYQLHEKFEELYDRWAELVDEVAERIVQLGETPAPTLAGALKDASLREQPETPDAKTMIREVIADMKAQKDQYGKVVAAAEEAGDRTTANMLDPAIDGIEKDLWMLNAVLAG